MTATQLKEWIEENSIELKWHPVHDHLFGNNAKQLDVLIFPRLHQAKGFHKLLDPGIFDDNGIPCRFKDGYLAIWMGEICERYGIKLEEVFDVIQNNDFKDGKGI